MNAIKAALKTVLRADATLAGILSTFDGVKAVFGSRLVPGDADPPYMVIIGPITTSDWSSKGANRGYDTYFDIACVAASEYQASALAERAYAVLHRQALTVTGFSVADVRCSGPQDGPSIDEEITSKMIGVRIKATES